MSKLNRRGEISAELYEEKKASKLQTPEGYEIPDATPMEPPLGFVRQPSLAERIREMVRSEHLRQAAEAAGVETFEEADDFEVSDDLEPMSGYENDAEFEPALPVESTGVPPPGGGGKGGGEPEDGPEPAAPVEAAPAPPAAPPAKPAKVPPKRS